MKVKRIFSSISLLNALRVPYLAYNEEGKKIGVIYLNPVFHEPYKDSKAFLEELGYTGDIKFEEIE